MTDPKKHHEPAGDDSGEDQPRLDPEAVKDLESRGAADAVRAASGRYSEPPTDVCCA